MGEIKLSGFLCERCEHAWIPRSNSNGSPTVCPKCKSPYWNTPRKNQDLKQTKETAGKQIKNELFPWINKSKEPFQKINSPPWLDKEVKR